MFECDNCQNVGHYLQGTAQFGNARYSVRRCGVCKWCELTPILAEPAPKKLTAGEAWDEAKCGNTKNRHAFGNWMATQEPAMYCCYVLHKCGDIVDEFVYRKAVDAIDAYMTTHGHEEIGG